MKNLTKFTEVVALFIAIPITFLALGNLPRIPILVLVGLAVIGILLLDKKFDKKRFNSINKKYFRVIFIRALVATPLLTILALFTVPEPFALPLSLPLLWLLIIVLYPVLSAYPQEIIYRGFLFHRYSMLFPKNFLNLVSSFFYSFLHIIYQNPVAIVLSFIGGYLLSKTYSDTKSLLMVGIEHAIYGQIVFTVGLGTFFFKPF
jgi:uncharacterized protein